jgi:glutaredoxin
MLEYDMIRKGYSSREQIMEIQHPPHITFYTKAGCHLCDDARELLDELAAQHTYLLDEIDIRRDLTLFEQYRYRIPVILLNETLIAEGRIEYEDLDAAFKWHKEEKDDRYGNIAQ